MLRSNPTQRMMADHELQRQRVAEGVKLQEESHSRHEMERLRVEQMIQAERKSSEAYSVSTHRKNACAEGKEQYTVPLRW